MASTQPTVSIRESVIGSAAVPSVSARDLHRAVGSKRQFSNWILDRIEKYGFIQGMDFMAYRDSHENVTSKEYMLSLDMAKELAMVEQTGQGKVVRRYFIDMEKRYLADKSQPSMLPAPGQAHDGPGYARVTSLDLDRLEDRIAQIKASLPPEKRPVVARKIWGDIWQIAGGRRDTRRQLPSERMPLYLTYLTDAAAMSVAVTGQGSEAVEPSTNWKAAVNLPLPDAACKLGLDIDDLNRILCEAHVCVRPGVLSRSYASGTLFQQPPSGPVIITRRGQIWLSELIRRRHDTKAQAQLPLLSA